MSIEGDVGKLESIHRAGIKVIVDSDSWFRDAGNLAKAQRDYPLNPAISATRVDAVAEGLRIAFMLDRPRVPPPGRVYAHSEADLRAAFDRIARHVLKSVREKSHDEPDNGASGGGEPPAGGSADKGAAAQGAAESESAAPPRPRRGRQGGQPAD